MCVCVCVCVRVCACAVVVEATATGVSAIPRTVRTVACPHPDRNGGADLNEWPREQSIDDGRSTLVQLKQMAYSYSLMEKSLRQGSNRCCRHRSVKNYSDVCRHGEHPAAFSARLQKMRPECKRLGQEVQLPDLLVRVKTGLEIPYPLLTATFNPLDSPGQPAHNSATDDTLTVAKYAKWLSLAIKEFQKQYPDVRHKTAPTSDSAGSAMTVRTESASTSHTKRKFSEDPAQTKPSKS